MKSGNEGNQNNAKGAGNDARRRPKKPTCVSCQEQGKNDCYHCYICESDEHYARGCKKSHTTALWDTGAQVSITLHEWVKENLGDITINPLEELVGTNLQLKAANGTTIPYLGWV